MKMRMTGQYGEAKHTAITFYGKTLGLKVVAEGDPVERIQAYSMDEELGYWEPFATLSIKVLPNEFPEDDGKLVTFVAKTYSENAGICEELMKMGVLTHTDKYHYIGGFVGHQPILTFRVRP